MNEILSFILQQIAGGVIGNASWTGANWLLAAILGSGTSSENQQVLGELAEIETTLQQLVDAITALENEVTQIGMELILNQDFDTLQETISQPIGMIETAFQTFAALTTTTDQSIAQELQTDIMDANDGVAPALYSINAAILDSPLRNPTQPYGLLSLWVRACAASAVSGSSFSPAAVGFGSPLDVAYTNLTTYFSYLVGVQIKGLSLLVNAYNAAGGTNVAASALATFQSSIRAQLATFVSAAEYLCAYYCQDVSLIQMLAGPLWQADPVRRACALSDSIASSLVNSGTNTFYVRLWGGQGTMGSFSFGGYDGSSNPVSQSNGNVVCLKASNGDLLYPDIQPDGSYNAFFQFTGVGTESAWWSLFRFSWTNPPPGQYTVVMQDETQLGPYYWSTTPVVANIMIVPTNPTSPFSSGLQATVIGENSFSRTSYGSYCGINFLQLYKGYVATTATTNFGNGDFTLEAWVQSIGPGGSSSNMILSNKCNFGASGGNPGMTGVLLSFTSDGKLHVAVDNGFTYYSIDSVATSVCDGQWHHVAATRKSYILSLWLDGQQLEATSHEPGTPDSMNLTTCAPWWIGAYNNWNGVDSHDTDPQQYCEGALSFVRVWSLALSQTELQQSMTFPFFTTTTGMLHSWGFFDGTMRDAVAGTNAEIAGDSSTNNCAVLPAVWSPPSRASESTLVFDGTGSGYVQVPGSSSLSVQSSVVLSAWVYLPSDCPTNMKVIAASSFILGIGEGDQTSDNTYRSLYPEFWDSQGNHMTFQTGQIYFDEWTLITACWTQGATLQGYVNGVQVYSGAVTDYPLAALDGSIFFGIATNQQAFPFAGSLGPLSISEGSINLYAGYWPVSDGSGTMVTDQSGNANNGTICGKGVTWGSVGGSVARRWRPRALRFTRPAPTPRSGPPRRAHQGDRAK